MRAGGVGWEGPLLAALCSPARAHSCPRSRGSLSAASTIWARRQHRAPQALKQSSRRRATPTIPMAFALVNSHGHSHGIGFRFGQVLGRGWGGGRACTDLERCSAANKRRKKGMQAGTVHDVAPFFFPPLAEQLRCHRCTRLELQALLSRSPRSPTTSAGRAPRERSGASVSDDAGGRAKPAGRPAATRWAGAFPMGPGRGGYCRAGETEEKMRKARRKK